MTKSPAWFDRLDLRVTGAMARVGPPLLRISLGVVFFWFGVLKFFPGMSPAQDLATRTIHILTFGAVPPGAAIVLLATWECLVGIGLIFGVFMRATLLLLLLQMIGTMTPSSSFPTRYSRAFRTPRRSRGNTSSRTLCS